MDAHREIDYTHLKHYDSKYGLVIYLTCMDLKCCLIKNVYGYDKIYFKFQENKTSVKVIEEHRENNNNKLYVQLST